MKKRAACFLLLCLLMALGALSATASAAGRQEDLYDIYLHNPKGDSAGEGWSYEHSTKTLTLRDFHGTKGIYFFVPAADGEAPVRIVAEGSNTLTVSGTASAGVTAIDAVSDADGNIYAVPLDTHAEVLYYNLDILEKAGVEVAEDGTLDIKNVDDFNGICEKIKAVMGEGESAVSITSKDDDPWRVFWATYNQMGGSPILTDDWSAANMDKETAKKAAEFVKSIYDNGYALTGIEDHQKFFQAGSAGLLIGGTWARGALEQTESLNFGEMPWPQLFDQPAVFADQHTFILPVNPNRTEEESVAAVQFMISASRDGGATWAQSGQIPACKQVVESEEFLALPGRANLVSILDNAVYSYSCPTTQAIETDMKNSLNEYWAGSIDADTLVDYLVEAIENNLP